MSNESKSSEFRGTEADVRAVLRVFYDLDRDNMTVNIRNRCCTLAYPYGINIRNLHTKMAHLPYFISKTWQEKALKVLKDEPLYFSQTALFPERKMWESRFLGQGPTAFSTFCATFAVRF